MAHEGRNRSQNKIQGRIFMLTAMDLRIQEEET
jgi:hypothetical protein